MTFYLCFLTEELCSLMSQKTGMCDKLSRMKHPLFPDRSKSLHREAALIYNWNQIRSLGPHIPHLYFVVSREIGDWVHLTVQNQC